MIKRLVCSILTAAFLLSSLQGGVLALGERVFDPTDVDWEAEFIQRSEPPEGMLENAVFADSDAEPGYSLDYPNTHVNTGNQQYDIVKVALTQVGYKETGDNHTKYNAWYAYGKDVPFEWCGIFISWCAAQAEIPSTTIKYTGLAGGYHVSNMQQNSYGCPAYSFQSTIPQPGDIAYITASGTGSSTHVGLVYDVDALYIYTVEGNASNAVALRKYSRFSGFMSFGDSNVPDAAKILFYARPNYQGTDKDTTGSDPGNSETVEDPIDGFVDVSKTAFYAEPVVWALENGITNGIGDNRFGPELVCTRGQVVTFLWRAAGEPESILNYNPFTDVDPEDYFYDAVCWAVENGITMGVGDDRYAPDMVCTRGQVATFLWRANGSPVPQNAAGFTDVAEDAFYGEAVAWASEQEITLGIGDNRFGPDLQCRRGQIVTFLFRSK